MKLSDFKAIYKIATSIDFIKSSKSSRHVAFVEDMIIVTTEIFDPKKPAFVYDNPVEGAIKGKSFIISNNSAEVKFSL